MATKQGELGLLDHPVAQELLRSTVPARLAYNWTDGTPRVVPIWFHWDGKEIVMGTPPGAPKLKALGRSSKVAVTIDSNSWPHHVLLIRGTARVTEVQGVVSEYAAAAERYLGAEGGKGWVQQAGGLFKTMGRVAVTPEWVAIHDFETRWPSAVERAMAGAAAG
jgi:hypothetical protein